MVGCSGVHSTAQLRHMRLETPPTIRVLTHISQNARLHLLHRYRAGDFGWNLQKRGPEAAAPVIGGAMGGVSTATPDSRTAECACN